MPALSLFATIMITSHSTCGSLSETVFPVILVDYLISRLDFYITKYNIHYYTIWSRCTRSFQTQCQNIYGFPEQIGALETNHKDLCELDWLFLAFGSDNISVLDFQERYYTILTNWILWPLLMNIYYWTKTASTIQANEEFSDLRGNSYSAWVRYLCPSYSVHTI